MAVEVCSSSTGETEMAQTLTKRAGWRTSASSGSRPSQGTMACGPLMSGKRLARANC